MAQLADPGQPGRRQHAERPLRHAHGDPGTEQGDGHEPPLDLRLPGVDVDAELGGLRCAPDPAGRWSCAVTVDV
jgi:hypothetical protein